MRREFIQKLEQTRQRLAAGVLIAHLDLNAQHQAKPAHQIGVVTMRRPHRLFGVVRHHRPILLAIQRLDRRIDVQYPRHIQQERHTVAQMTIEQMHARVFGNCQQDPAQCILADHLAHPQQTGLTPSQRIVVTCE